MPISASSRKAIPLQTSRRGWLIFKMRQSLLTLQANYINATASYGGRHLSRVCRMPSAIRGLLYCVCRMPSAIRDPCRDKKRDRRQSNSPNNNSVSILYKSLPDSALLCNQLTEISLHPLRQAGLIEIHAKNLAAGKNRMKLLLQFFIRRHIPQLKG